MANNFNQTREAYIERFINAETSYRRYLILQDLLSWVEDLQELNDCKDAKIVALQNEVKGYDLSDYQD
jgi:hypothetical protein